MSKTIEYYNNNSNKFYDKTIKIDLSDMHAHFLKYLPKKAHILDAGCGVGRDAKYFESQGYEVTAFDASQKMCDLASSEINLPVSCYKFQDLNFSEVFDGVWASVSLLHVPYDETISVYQKIHQSLKPNGIFYASYKYGFDFEETPERDFYHMNEEKIQFYLKGLFEPLEMFKVKDHREKITCNVDSWFHFIARKI